MATTFTSLPIIDLTPLCSPNPSEENLQTLSLKLHKTFKTVGFAYLVNAPLSFNHEQVFQIAKDFFAKPHDTKMKLAKQAFVKSNQNTYRGYFPAQQGSDNLKEGFEIGPTPAPPPSKHQAHRPINLTEPNVFPDKDMENMTATLYKELQSLSSTLLALLATSLNKSPETFTNLLENSVSTLRLLHYPAIQPPAPQQELNCTPHTDSGLLTLLHQDSTGGLEVLNASGQWIPAPYVPGSLVVNIGDLMAKLSGGLFVATYHRVRSSGRERYSVPFFCEPGVDALVPVGEAGQGERYERFVLGKMDGWVEFSTSNENEDGAEVWGGAGGNAVAVGA